MALDGDLEHDLAVLDRTWQELIRVPDPPRTMLNIIEYSLGDRRKAEEYTNRLLRYLLDPTASHGMGAEFLRAVLERLPEACGFDEDTYDVADVHVSDQVRVERAGGNGAAADADSPGVVDLVIEVPNEWVLLVELKFRAGENNLRGEGLSQTEFYAQADCVGGEPIREYESGTYYLYLHHRDEPPARAPEFVNWTWAAFSAEVLEPFIAAHGPRFPQRTVTQLRDLVDDLHAITDMTDQEHHDQEKVELYLEHYDAIKDVSETFDAQWAAFADDWRRRLAERLSTEHDATYVEASDEVIEVTFPRRDSSQESWRFLTRQADWGMLFKEGWWRHTEDLTPIDRRPDDRNDARIGYHHRLDHNRDRAIGDNELRVYFRNMGANDQGFIDAFVEEFESRRGEIASCLPAAAELTGTKRNMIQATYDIQPEGADDFFAAYVSALAVAFRELVVENPELVDLLTEAYDAAAEMYR